MDLLLIACVACFASLLTFFSGFGLGTLLTPVMVLFFPVEVAIALTGIVHFLNNCFKITLVWKEISWPVILRFAPSAFVGAFAGAAVLISLSKINQVIYMYTLGSLTCEITYIKLCIGILMLVFVLFEIVPSLMHLQFSKKHLLVGGLVSGFFGGLSGNQGALRSMFLLRSGLNKEAYIACGIFIACVVDISRLGVYLSRMKSVDMSANLNLLSVAVLSAFTGAWLGRKYLKKMTFKTVQAMVTGMIGLLALALCSGIL